MEFIFQCENDVKQIYNTMSESDKTMEINKGLGEWE